MKLGALKQTWPCEVVKVTHQICPDQTHTNIILPSYLECKTNKSLSYDAFSLKEQHQNLSSCPDSQL